MTGDHLDLADRDIDSAEERSDLCDLETIGGDLWEHIQSLCDGGDGFRVKGVPAVPQLSTAH